MIQGILTGIWVILMIAGVIVMVGAVAMLIRNQHVYKFRMSILNRMWDEYIQYAHTDSPDFDSAKFWEACALIDRRRKLFNSVEYNDMMRPWDLLKPFESYYDMDLFEFDDSLPEVKS